MEGRQVHRREPLEVTLDSGQHFWARPLRWQTRNALGDEIVQQYIQSTNDWIKIETDSGGDSILAGTLPEKLKDPLAVLRLAYPDNQDSEYDELVYEELLELILAAIDVNRLERLRFLVDPNLLTRPESSGTNSADRETQPESDTGEKTESSPDSSSSDSADQTS